MATADADARIGRPPGPELVVRSHGLALHDLAVLRAVVQGLAVKAAVARYLPELTADERVARGHVLRLAREVRMQLVALGEPAMADALRRLTPDDASDAAETQAAGPPSLDEFARTLEADMYSERELVELYQETYGRAPALAPTQSDRFALVQRALNAIALIQARSVKVPSGDDPLPLWLSDRLCQQLRPFGVLRLRELVHLINRGGRNWFSQVEGLGRTRAQRLVQWLLDHESYTGAAVSARVRGLAQLEAVPSATHAGEVIALTGPSSLRSQGANALGAQSDRQALQAWLATLEMKSRHTRQAYLRDVERLLLWARERGRSLSSLTVEDAVDHARFLSDPPPHWVNELPATRRMADWRPMRGPLTRSSANRALAATGHLYGFLVESGYLVANPFARVRSVGRPEALHERLDTRRSFGGRHLQAMAEHLAAMPDDAAKRRLLAILMLAETTGMRRFELAGHTWGDLRELPGERDDPMMGLSVRGKGGQERLLPIRPAVIEALQRHRTDRDALVERGLLDALPLEHTPLISVLDPAVRLCQGQPDGGLSESRMYRVLKAFFRAVGASCEDEQLQADFSAASCHWLRHTFAHEVLKASGNDLPVTQQLLGHRSISTTGIYLKADVGQRIDAVRALPERFV